MATTEELLIFLRANTSDFERKFATAGRQVEEFSVKSTGGLAGFARLGGVALATTAAATALIGVTSVKAALDFEKSHARLENAVKNAGGSFDAERSKIDAVDKAMERFGFNAADTENALSRLVTATGSVTTAQKDLAIATDLAAARHLTLEAATDVLVKVESGRYTQLGRLGIATKAQVKGFKDSGEAVQFLADKYKGAGEASADTFAGKMKALDATITDVGVSIGQDLIPVIESMASGFADTIHFFEENAGAAQALGIAVGAVLVPAMATFIGLKVASFATTIANGFRSVGTAVSTVAGKLVGTSGAFDTLAVSMEAEATANTASIAAAEARNAALSAQIILASDAAAATEAQAIADDALGTSIGAQYAAMAGLASANAALADSAAVAAVAEADLAAALDAEAIAAEASAAATTGAWTAVLGPIALAAAAIYAITDALGYWDDELSKVQAHAGDWAKGVVQASQQAGHGTEDAKVKMSDLGDEIDRLRARQDTLQGSLNNGTFLKYGQNASDVRNKIRDLGSNIDDLKSRHDALGPAIKAVTERHKEAAVAAGYASVKEFDVAKALETAGKAADDAAKKTQTYADATFKLFDAQFKAQDATKALTDDLAKIGKDKAPLEDLQKDILGIVQAQGELAAQQLGPSASASAQAQASADAERASLLFLKAAYPDLAGSIDAYLFTLQANIDKSKDANATNDAAIKALDGLKAKYPELAGQIDALEGALRRQQSAQDGANSSGATTQAILDGLKAQYPSLAAQIDILGASIRNLPDSKNIDIHVRTHTDTIGGVLGDLHVPGVSGWVGGPVRGQRDQPVPMLLHGGEYVLDADTVNAIKRGTASRFSGRQDTQSGATGSSAGGDTIVYVTAQVADGNGLVRVLKDYERDNGGGWRGAGISYAN